ncbi:cobalt-zinc-cadmium efflux system protein [Colwellia chukchiensis]|uniref:Cobalt-zinc-cadmium efflux system protein n=1 Tax=Colwellia chukchiensis TaxID=641665 RepID=A0A1H7NQ97_9GAMM|nr:cation diffusion facilitator family transporter [Colwellia chukchiensis]SEL25730.1 cobalt-zinc-cadmium efflux system protein [Colwellia chukchiensis]
MNTLTTHKSSQRRLLIALAITSVFMLIQLFGAYYANSLAVYADAGHLFVHNSSLFIALIASTLAIKFGRTFSDGYRRLELSGGLINGSLYLLISCWIIFQGADRLLGHEHHNEHEINTFVMSTTASLGFLFHAASAIVLYKGRKDSVNVYAVFLHTFFDILSTIVTFVTSVVIHATGWTAVDSLSSIFISIFVLYTGSKLLYRCVKGLFFNGVRLPALKKIEAALLTIDHIDNVHNLIVQCDNDQVVVGAHIVLKHECTIEKHDQVCRMQIERVLKEQFAVSMSVLQIEAYGCQHN